MSPAFERPKVKSIDLPDTNSKSTYRKIRWAEIERDFERTVDGLGLSEAERTKRLDEKKRQYERVARAATMRGDGHTYVSIAGSLRLSAPAIRSWMKGTNLPMSISPKMAKAHLNGRVLVDLNSASPHDMGYLLGHQATGLLKLSKGRVGKTRFGLHTASQEVHEQSKKALSSVFGIEPNVRVREAEKESHRPVRSLELDSAEAAKAWSRMFGEEGHVRTFLEGDPEARLGFTRAIADTPRVNGAGGIVKRNGEIEIRHPDKKTLLVVSQTLTENGVGHNLNRGGSITIPKRNSRSFAETVGFRDSKKAGRLRR